MWWMLHFLKYSWTQEEAIQCADLGEIVGAKFDFDVVGQYARPEILSLSVKDHPLTPVSFSASEQNDDNQNRSKTA